MAPRGYIGLVGESHYQDALNGLMATAQQDRIVTVGVEREPSNPFDSKAIRVFDPATGQTLAYLPHGATGFAKLLKEHSVRRHAQLTGGTSDKPSIGLVLHLHGEQEDSVQWQQPREPTVVATANGTPVTQGAARSSAASAPHSKSGGGVWSIIRGIFDRKG